MCDVVPRPVDFCTCKHFGRLLTFHWGHLFLLLPTLGGKHSFENRRNNTFSLGRPKLQKRTNHLEILRTYMLWHSRRRGVEKHSFSTPTEHGDQKQKRSARSMGITVRVFSTPLARERPFCNSYLTRTSTRSLVPREPKWQYDRRNVAKGGKGTKHVEIVEVHVLVNVTKTSKGSTIC